MKYILLAEDDTDYALILKQYLEISGFTVTRAENGHEALSLAQQALPDIFVLDVMMPVMDGFTLAENLVSLYPDIPFVFLTARGLKEDKIKGLRLGADDYVVKPFEADELILRINNILKRIQKLPALAQDKKQLAIGSYIFDRENFTLKHNEAIQRITEREAALIYYLYTNRNRLLKREDILREVWGNDDFFSGRSMDVFISRLRKYFIDDPGIAISGIRGLGLEFTINTK